MTHQTVETPDPSLPLFGRLDPVPQGHFRIDGIRRVSQKTHDPHGLFLFCQETSFSCPWRQNKAQLSATSDILASRMLTMLRRQ